MVKMLGAIAALREIAAFNAEVASELRAVFNDFRSTKMGSAFEVAGVENFLTDDIGQSSFAMYNKPGHPEFALQIEIQSSGTADISIGQVSTDPSDNKSDLTLNFGDGVTPDTAAARVLGAILDLDQSTDFGKNFHKYIRTRFTGNDHSPSVDFVGPAQG